MESQKKNFLIGEAVKFGWETMKANFWFFAGVVALILGVSVIGGPLTTLIGKESAFAGFILSVATWVLSLVLQVGGIRVALAFVDGRKPAFSELFPFFIFWKYLMGALLYALIVFCGFILFVVPGIVWAIKYRYFSYLILEKGLGAKEAIKMSGKITDGVKWKILGFDLTMMGIMILSMIPLGLGMFATIPLAMLASALVYRKLLQQTEAVPVAQVNPPAAV